MLPLNLSRNVVGGMTILCIGAHSDDIEIGCGGTLLHLKATIPEVKFHWVVMSGSGLRGQEAAKSASLFTSGCENEVVLRDYRDGFLPYDGALVKTFFEQIKTEVAPDLIFTHWKGDAHQDHRLLAELTWNTFRDHMILEYEIPKYDGDMGQPNVFVPLESDVPQMKIRYLLEAFQSQRSKRWFQESTFLALMRLRGMECNSSSGYAEAFYGRKLTL